MWILIYGLIGIVVGIIMSLTYDSGKSDMGDGLVGVCVFVICFALWPLYLCILAYEYFTTTEKTDD